MAKLVECIPNFSVSKEKDPEVFEGLVAVAKSIPGCFLFDIQSDGSHNRCVFTLLGSPEGIEEAAKAVFLLAAFCIGGRTVRDYSIIAGAAIGAGFMAFSAVETAMLLPEGGTFIAFARHLPFGHVASTAILGCALYGLRFGDTGALRAWSAVLFALPVLIHVLWVADIGIPWIVKYFAFGLISWGTAFFLLGLLLLTHREWLSSACFARDGAAGSFGKTN